jgi:hypothetical protein
VHGSCQSTVHGLVVLRNYHQRMVRMVRMVLRNIGRDVILDVGSGSFYYKKLQDNYNQRETKRNQRKTSYR